MRQLPKDCTSAAIPPLRARDRWVVLLKQARFSTQPASPVPNGERPPFPAATSGYTGHIMSKRPRRRPRRLDTLLVGFACMLALITAMGLQIRPFTYLWVSLYTGVAVAVLAVSLTMRLEHKY